MVSNFLLLDFDENCGLCILVCYDGLFGFLFERLELCAFFEGLNIGSQFEFNLGRFGNPRWRKGAIGLVAFCHTVQFIAVLTDLVKFDGEVLSNFLDGMLVFLMERRYYAFDEVGGSLQRALLLILLCGILPVGSVRDVVWVNSHSLVPVGW